MSVFNPSLHALVSYKDLFRLYSRALILSIFLIFSAIVILSICSIQNLFEILPAIIFNIFYPEPNPTPPILSEPFTVSHVSTHPTFFIVLNPTFQSTRVETLQLKTIYKRPGDNRKIKELRITEKRLKETKKRKIEERREGEKNRRGERGREE